MDTEEYLTVSNVRTDKVMVAFVLDIQLKQFPKSYKELAEKMRIAVGQYLGPSDHKAISLFFYAMAGYLIKPMRKDGDFYWFRAEMTEAVELLTFKIDPVYPIRWNFAGEDNSLNPNVLISFQLEVTNTSMNVDPLSVVAHKHMPKSIRAKNQELNFRIFNDFGFTLTGIDDDYVIRN